VLLLTFILTVFVDLSIAVQVGIVVASLLFMRRMADITNVEGITDQLRDLDVDDPGEISIVRRRKRILGTRELPTGVEVYEVNGPFFFGVADKLQDVLSEIDRPPRVFILRMRHVPAIDATGMHALEQMAKRCRHENITMIICEVGQHPLNAIVRSGKLEALGGRAGLAKTLEMALSYAEEIIASDPTMRAKA
jgi:sulfate permease, SulP family